MLRQRNNFLSLLRLCGRTCLPSQRQQQGIRWISVVKFAEEEGGGDGGAVTCDYHEVGVFWDYENCRVPIGLDPYLVRPNIELALRKNGYLGPIFVKSYGNIQSICNSNFLQAFTETGIDIRHVPNGGKNSCDRVLLTDVLLWATEHMAPAHVFLISGDSDFAILLHKLKMLRYNILLACQTHKGMATALVTAASKVWVWPDIAKGEGLWGQTPIHGITVLHEDTAPANNQESQVSEDSVERNASNAGIGSVQAVSEDLVGQDWISAPSCSKVQSTPTEVSNQIFRILKARQGLSLAELGRELRLQNIDINERYHGYRNFCKVLRSLEGITLKKLGTGNFKVRYQVYVTDVDVSDRSNSIVDLVSETNGSGNPEIDQGEVVKSERPRAECGMHGQEEMQDADQVKLEETSNDQHANMNKEAAAQSSNTEVKRYKTSPDPVSETNGLENPEMDQGEVVKSERPRAECGTHGQEEMQVAEQVKLEETPNDQHANMNKEATAQSSNAEAKRYKTSQDSVSETNGSENPGIDQGEAVNSERPRAECGAHGQEEMQVADQVKLEETPNDQHANMNKEAAGQSSNTQTKRSMFSLLRIFRGH